MKKLISVLMVLLMILASACCSAESIPGLEDGVLTVAMECAYAPYNWAQPDDSNGAVPIKDSMLYANGYDVMTAKAICEANGWKLEVLQLDWDSLIPAVQSGICDAVIAGQSMTSERMESVDFAGPYLYASIVCLTKKDSAFAGAKGISDLTGGTCTSQSGTIWYDSCLPQIPDAQIQMPAESAPAMLMAVASGTVDYVCTDMPTAQGALIAYPDLMILDFHIEYARLFSLDINLHRHEINSGNIRAADRSAVAKGEVHKAVARKKEKPSHQDHEHGIVRDPVKAHPYAERIVDQGDQQVGKDDHVKGCEAL